MLADRASCCADERIRLTAHKLRYFVIAAAISYAIPNLLMFSAMPHLGAGYTGIMFTLSPVITLVLSILLGVRRPNLLGVAGIAVGFVGAVMVATTRGEAGQPAALFWVAIGAAHPAQPGRRQHLPHLRLAGRHRADRACRRQPPRGGGDAACRHCRAATAAARSASWPELPLRRRSPRSPRRPAMFVFFFRLQAVGGPVYLSQIGYVGAAVGLFSGTLFLGERYALLTWLGAAIIVAGVFLTTKAQSAKA